MVNYKCACSVSKRVYYTVQACLYYTVPSVSVMYMTSVPVLYSAIVPPVLFSTAVLCCMYNTSVLEPTKRELQACLQHIEFRKHLVRSR